MITIWGLPPKLKENTEIEGVSYHMLSNYPASLTEDPLKEGMATLLGNTPVFSPGESPWTEEPGGLQRIRLQRVGHDWATKPKDLRML